MQFKSNCAALIRQPGKAMPNDVVRLEMTAETKRALRKLQQLDIMPDLRRELRAVTQPMVTAVRRAVRAIPSSRTRRQAKDLGGSLRTAVAMAVKQKVKASGRQVVAAVVVNSKGGKANLARVLEGTIPWKHQTYGHEPEVTQESHPYFYGTLEPYGHDAYKRIEYLIDTIEKKLLCLLSPSRNASTAVLRMNGFSMAQPCESCGQSNSLPE